MQNISKIHISDFTLHTIGVILFQENKERLLSKFVNDTMSKVSLMALSPNRFRDIISSGSTHKLDFDDAYQHCLAKLYSLEFVTLDTHFKGISDIRITFL